MKISGFGCLNRFKKNTAIILLILLFFFGFSLLMGIQVNAQLSGGGEANPDLPTNQEALKTFQDMRSGD